MDDNIRKSTFSREYYELRDYNRSLEMDIDTLKAEIAGLVCKHKKEKKSRKTGEARSTLLEAE